MTLPTSGPLSLDDIATEFGGSVPHSLSEYYAGGGLVPAGASGTYGLVPSSGQISIQNFYGTSAVYPIDYGLRFNSADNTYLSRTFGTPTNNKQWTMSMWVKRSTLGTNQALFSQGYDGSDYFDFNFNTSDQLYIQNRVGASNLLAATTTVIFRDTSAWYHIVFVFDSDNATASYRNRLWINGVEYLWSANSGSGNASSFNRSSAQPHVLGVSRTLDASGTLWKQFNGYMAEVHFVDGQALAPTSFGVFNSSTGVWNPVQYTGTYGDNGFYLPFNEAYPSFAAEYAVIAGGGGGGGGEATGGGGGGGGAGGAIYASSSLYAGPTYIVTVGAGGSAGGLGGIGNNSVLGSITAYGGGGGARRYSGNATSGGSGGGAQYYAGPTSPGSGITGQGNSGGIAESSGGGGGGGGKGSAGGTGGVGGVRLGGAGGTGFDISSYFGTFAPNSGLVAGGGGGGAGNYVTGATSTGGSASHGGATGGAYNGGQVAPGVAVVNTGGGGGGGGNNDSSVGYSGSAGASGVVMIKIPDTYRPTFSSGVTYTPSVALSGYSVYKVTATSTTSETVTFAAGKDISILVVAGGGGGGAGNVSTNRTRSGGGGGGGGVRLHSGSITFGTAYTITVGAGGGGGTNDSIKGSNGNNSVFDTTTSSGGGGGGSSSDENGVAGGSGGGASTTGAGAAGNIGGYTPVEGYAGANGGPNSGSYYGGGGGGAGAASTGQSGGTGYTSAITGSNVVYAYGGTGGQNGSQGATQTIYGSGGGGGAYNSGTKTGATGKNGVVIIRVIDGVTCTFSGGVTASSTTSGGYRIYTVTATSTTSETVTFS